MPQVQCLLFQSSFQENVSRAEDMHSLLTLTESSGISSLCCNNGCPERILPGTTKTPLISLAVLATKSKSTCCSHSGLFSLWKLDFFRPAGAHSITYTHLNNCDHRCDSLSHTVVSYLQGKQVKPADAICLPDFLTENHNRCTFVLSYNYTGISPNLM